MPLIGIKSKGSEFDAATISVDRVERAGLSDVITLWCASQFIGHVDPWYAEIDDDLAELLRVYDAAQAKENA